LPNAIGMTNSIQSLMQAFGNQGIFIGICANFGAKFAIERLSVPGSGGFPGATRP
jgi:hypothetical protein